MLGESERNGPTRIGGGSQMELVPLPVPPNAQAQGYTGWYYIHFMVKHAPVAQVVPGSTCADDEWLIQGIGRPCPDFEAAIQMAVQAVLHDLQRKVSVGNHK